MPSFTTKDLLVELRERFATGGMMPIPQLTLQDTELMWQCLWDVAEAQALSELQHLVATKKAKKEKMISTAVATATKNNKSGGGNNNQTFGLKLGIGSGAGGGSAFSVLVGGSGGGGGIYDDSTENNNHHHNNNPAATIVLKIHQDFLSHYNLKCSKMQTLSSSPTHTPTSFSPPPREQDVNAAKMFFEVANGCKDPPSSCIDNDDECNDSRPSTSSSSMGNCKKRKGGGTSSSSLKSSRNFSHELCRRFIRTVAEAIGEKGARWDVSIEFPPFGVLRIKERVIDFTVCLSPKLQLAASSSTDSDNNNNNNVQQGQQQVLSSKPPLTPFSSQEKRVATGDDDDAAGLGGGGGSPLRRVLREQARERMLLQKHGDSYIRARVDAKNAPKGGFNSCGIGIDHNVIDTSETDSLFVIRPSTSSTVPAGRGGGAHGGGDGSLVQPQQQGNNNNVTDMKRLLISHRALRPPSSTASNGSGAPSITKPNKNTSLPRVGGGRGGADAVTAGGTALVRALDSQLHSLRERLTGPLAVMEGELYAAASPARSDASPSRTIPDDTEGGGRSKGGRRRDSTSSGGGGGLTIGLGGRIRSPPISLQAMTAMPTTTAMPTAAMTTMPTLPTTRQLNHRTVQGGGGGYARKSTKMLDAMGTTQLQDQAMKSKAYREELDQQTCHSSTTKKTKRQLEKDADSKRIELDVLSAANDILSEMSQKNEMKIEMSLEAAEIAKRKDIKHEAEMLKRAGEGNTTKKRGGGGRGHHPQSKHIV